MHTGISQRIIAARERAGLRQTELARKIEISRQVMSDWERGRTSPRPAKMKPLADALNVTVEWLLYGDAKDLPPAAPRDPAAMLTTISVSAATEVSGGGGGGVNPYIVQIDVSKEWVAQMVDAPQSKKLRLFFVRGDSMEPTLADKDACLVDLTSTRADDAVFAIKMNDEVMIKRLQRLPGGKLSMISDNRRFPPVSVTPDDIEILGRVLFAWHGLKP